MMQALIWVVSSATGAFFGYQIGMMIDRKWFERRFYNKWNAELREQNAHLLIVQTQLLDQCEAIVTGHLQAYRIHESEN